MNELNVTNPLTKATQTISLSIEEMEKVEKLSAIKTINPFLATLIPVRTHNWKSFSKDLFLPTLINHAIKVNDAAGKIFAIIGAIILDLLTLPVRLVMASIRVFSSNKKENHDLYKFLKDKGVSKEILDTAKVRLNLKWEGEFRSTFTYNNDGTVSTPVKQYNKAFTTSFVDVLASFNSNQQVEHPKLIGEKKVSAPRMHTDLNLPINVPTFNINESSVIFFNIREMKIIIKVVIDGQTIVQEKILKTEKGKTLDKEAKDTALQNLRIEALNDLTSSNVRFSLIFLTIREEDEKIKYAYETLGYDFDKRVDGYELTDFTTSTSSLKEAFAYFPFFPEKSVQHLDENGFFLG